MGRRKLWRGIVCAAIILLGITPLASAGLPAAAQEDRSRYVEGMLRKLGRGIANIVTCPAELLRVPEEVGRRDGYVAALTVGPLQGVWRTLLRGVTGIYEVATFYAENPHGFEPLIKPEFAFGSLD